MRVHDPAVRTLPDEPGGTPCGPTSSLKLPRRRRRAGRRDRMAGVSPGRCRRRGPARMPRRLVLDANRFLRATLGVRLTPASWFRSDPRSQGPHVDRALMLTMPQLATALITGANQGLGLAIAEAYVEAGASVCCARATRRCSSERATRSLASQRQPSGSSCSRRRLESRRTCRRSLSTSAASVFAHVHVLVNNAGVYGPMGADRGGRLGGRGVGRWRSTSTDRCCRAARCCRISSSSATARSSSSRAAARPTRCRASAPTRRRRRPSCGSPRAGARRARLRHRRQLHRARRAQHADARRSARRRARTRSARTFYERMIRTSQGGDAARTGAALAVFLGSAASDGITGKLCSARSGIRGRRCRSASRRSRRHRHLHAAPHRARRIAAARGADR